VRSSVISGFTIRNGAPGIGVGTAFPSILNNILTNNICDGIFVSFRAALIQSNEISATINFNPTSHYWDYCVGSGLGINLAGTPNSSPAGGNSIIGNIIENNANGAIAIDAAQNTVIQSKVLRNNPGTGGLEAFNIIAISFIDNLVYDNSSTSYGLAAAASASLHVVQP